jgi:hypothetical protein
MWHDIARALPTVMRKVIAHAVKAWSGDRDIKFVFRNFRYPASAPPGERPPVSASFRQFPPVSARFRRFATSSAGPLFPKDSRFPPFAPFPPLI